MGTQKWQSTEMGWVAFAAGLLGFFVVYFSSAIVPPDYGAYLSIAALAGLDSVIGGARAAQAGNFKRRIFVSGFLMAVLLAVVLTWFGERIGVQIGLAAVFVFVFRIMQNLSIIRWYLLDDENPRLRWDPRLAKRTAPHASEPEAASLPENKASEPGF